MTLNASLVVCAVILSTVGSPAAAGQKKPDPLTVTLSSYVSTAQSDVIVRARVERDARSRELTIEWVSDDLSGGLHAVPLEGARAAVAHDYRLKRMSPGQYVVTTTLRLNDGKEVRRALNLTVVGGEGPGGRDTKVTGASVGGRSGRGIWDWFGSAARFPTRTSALVGDGQDIRTTGVVDLRTASAPRHYHPSPVASSRYSADRAPSDRRGLQKRCQG